MRPTLRQIAHELDLSVTTVSRALAGYGDVAAATRERVQAAATRAGYVPNSAGKSLVTGRTGFGALLLPIDERPQIDPFFSEFVAGVGEGLQQRGRDLFLATVSPQQSELDVLRRVVESGRADGVVLNRIAERDARVDYLTERGFPFITHGRTLHDAPGRCWVDTDGERAFAEAFNLLYALGHRRFGLISITEPMSFRRFRERGLEQAIQAVGDASVTLTTERTPRFDAAARARAASRMLSAEVRPTAVLALTDEIGLSVLEQAAALRLAVPDELSVIGFDNLPAAEWVRPALTTFDQRVRETARTLGNRLVDLIDGTSGSGDAPARHLLEATLMRRASHGPAPDAPAAR